MLVMTRRQVIKTAALATATFAFASTGTKGSAPLASDSSTPLPLAQRSFLLGLGHHPAHKKGETPADIQKALGEAIDLAARNSQVFSLWTMTEGWYEDWEKFYCRPTLEQRKALLRAYAARNLTPIFNTNFWSISPTPTKGLELKLSVPPDLPPSTTMASVEFRKRWMAHVTHVAREFQPAYFSLGNEIDSFYHYSPAQRQDFDNYVSLVADSYDAIQSVSPKTRVMIIFRYEEMVAKRGFDLINKIDFKKIDVFGFTTYPDLQGFASPAAMPPGYYRPIAERVGNVPIAFTEIGWATLPDDPKGQQHQAEFLTRFLQETQRMNLEMVVWPFLHDLAPPEERAKRSSYLGLMDYYGNPKEVWGLWRKLAALPFVKVADIHRLVNSSPLLLRR
ncbi:MAG: glycosyl hydrolase 53 family protein [Armatimonadetes bacterium]|nr:glycosyl hydrolase 53 family protein [Armatimonadota bacterium]